MVYLFGGLVVGVWLYLIAFRGGYWRSRERLERDVPPPPLSWPNVTAVIPARDEAETIARTIGSLYSQDYPGHLDVVLVDDGSSDGTAQQAHAAAEAAGAGDRLTILRGTSPPAGWAGKVWALQQGFQFATSGDSHPEYILLTDADITHAPSTLRNLVSRAASGSHVLTSVMAKLRCTSFAERCAVPAFVFFFQMLYPFGWVNRGDSRTVAAAGGCMLARTDALTRIGGFEAISEALIDDCALARQLKPYGPIWLGLSNEVRSIRRYETFAEVGRMVKRSAYAELRYSPLRLAAAIAGMTLTFLTPPLLALLASGHAAIPGASAYALMALSYQPTLRFYRVSPLWALVLPGIAVMYTAWTVQSAAEHAMGRGGRWKGRFQAAAGSVR